MALAPVRPSRTRPGLDRALPLDQMRESLPVATNAMFDKAIEKSEQGGAAPGRSAYDRQRRSEVLSAPVALCS